MDQSTPTSASSISNEVPSSQNKLIYVALASVFALLLGITAYLFVQNSILQGKIEELEAAIETSNTEPQNVDEIMEEPVPVESQNSNEKFLTPVTLTSGKFTHKDLPGFGMTVPAGWTVKIKSFDVTEDTTIPSDYFPTCSGNHCMHLNLSKGDVSLWTNFNIVMDSNGSSCIWGSEPQYEAIGSKWYRIWEGDSNVYVYDPALNVPSENVYFATGFLSSDEDSPSPVPEVYTLCSQGTGRMFEEDDLEEYGILMEDPLTTGKPDTATLEEINQMVSSIKGLEPGYKYTN